MNILIWIKKFSFAVDRKEQPVDAWLEEPLDQTPVMFNLATYHPAVPNQNNAVIECHDLCVGMGSIDSRTHQIHKKKKGK